ncbi:hypothetical protein BELL_0811g00040 [Botrytis elliptica]|uniref:Uncharacterized protein n=1 Tax=Botrytis elliptica TaxID=278938 RepID=A0A4Z1JB32_9HELO|nr:hypothetical protein EAE99_004629 [Botrytis elliptica]TGO68730.1 hypothetical protein BELL_0811g00040 [Botrytis elliptica]
MFSRLISYIRSITRGYRRLNGDDLNDVEKSTEKTPLIVKTPATPNHSGDHSDDKSKEIGKAHPTIEISEHFDVDLSLQGRTNQSDTVFVDPAIKKQIDESYDTIDCTSETSSNASELLPSEQHPKVSTFLELMFKPTQKGMHNTCEMENEQSNRVRYNSETYISTPSLNSFPRSPEAIQSSVNTLGTGDKRHNRA